MYEKTEDQEEMKALSDGYVWQIPFDQIEPIEGLRAILLAGNDKGNYELELTEQEDCPHYRINCNLIIEENKERKIKNIGSVIDFQGELNGHGNALTIDIQYIWREYPNLEQLEACLNLSQLLDIHCIPHNSNPGGMSHISRMVIDYADSLKSFAERIKE